jgi:hypothetical protein
MWYDIQVTDNGNIHYRGLKNSLMQRKEGHVWA